MSFLVEAFIKAKIPVIFSLVNLSVAIRIYLMRVFWVLFPFRPVYVSTVRPQSKHIVVIVDHGASVTETQLQIAKDAAQVILSSIDEHDKVSFLQTRRVF